MATQCPAYFMPGIFVFCNYSACGTRAYSEPVEGKDAKGKEKGYKYLVKINFIFYASTSLSMTVTLSGVEE